MKAVITGGRGFFGSHLVEHLLKNTDWKLVLFDKLSYASISLDRIKDMDTWDIYKDRVEFYAIDLTLPVPDAINKEIGDVDYILHLAAESHVDNSITDPVPFVMNNVSATLNILEYARTQPELKMFINFGTDEVYGPAPMDANNLTIKFPQLAKLSFDEAVTILDNGFPEFFYHNPSNPYSASKSAQEAIGIAYSNTYKVPVVTTHTMNLFGERQHPEKFLPMTIKNIMDGNEVTIHANEDCTKSGTRMYIHCRNVADALLNIVNKGYEGYDEWNIAGQEEVSNLELAQIIANVLGKELKYKMVDFHGSRPGHDLRYALDSSKLLDGYRYPKDFMTSLDKTIKWYLDRPEWLER